MWRTHISHSVSDPHMWGNNVIHCVADPQVTEKRKSALKSCRDFSSSKSYGYRGRKVAHPPKRKVLNVAEPHFSHCGGPICEEE